MLTKYNQNLHTHSTFCDGKDSPESTVLRAIELGFDSIGFSGHSYMSFSPIYSMSLEGTEEYKKEIARLKEVYKDKIDIFCGLELELFSECTLEGYDYIIGSVHYLKIGDEYFGFDRAANDVKEIIDKCFGGNGLDFAKAYYRMLPLLLERGKIDIIGHFDLITKNCEKAFLFDTECKGYKSAALEAIDALSEKVKVFELNTGAISRGYRTAPYLEGYMLKRLKERGCGIVISSDCHDNRFLDCHFNESLEFIKQNGFDEVLKLTKDGFKGYKI